MRARPPGPDGAAAGISSGPGRRNTMSSWLSPKEMKKVAPADTAAFRSPVPTQIVSNGEYTPLPQTPKQRQVQDRLVELADSYRKKMKLGRREFLKTASGMAAAFLAMNQ